MARRPARAALVLVAGAIVAATSGLVSAPPALATSTVVYVAAGGTDGTNTCEVAVSPCASLTHALSEVSSGGTIYVSGVIDIWQPGANPGDANGVSIEQDVSIAQAPGAPAAVLRGTGSSILTATTSPPGRNPDESGYSAAAGSMLTVGPYAVTLDDISLEDAYTSGYRIGGAITNSAGGTLTVDGCVFAYDYTNNNGVDIIGDGGAIDNGDGGTGTGTGTLVVKDSTFRDNTGGYDGGAIANADWGGSGTVTIQDSTFTNNEAANYDGGAIVNGDLGGTGTISIDGSTFTDNLAFHNDGGALDNGDNSTSTGTATVVDSTFHGNYAAIGAGIDNGDNNGAGTLTLVADSFVGDGLADPGHYLPPYEIEDSRGSGTDPVYAAANLFDGNCEGNGSGWVDDGYNASTSATCLGATPAASDAAVSPDVGANLGSLAANGGATETALVLTGNPALGLIPASLGKVPIGGVDYQLCAATDQRGVSSPSGEPCNAGSVQDTPLTVTVSGAQDYGDLAAFMYVTNPPGVPVTNLLCTTVGSNTSIGPSLPPGTYTVLGSSCSGDTAASYVATFLGAASGFTVSAVRTTTPTTPTLPPASVIPSPPSELPTAAFGSPTTATVSTTQATSVTSTYDGASATLTVPTGALPPGAVVAVYPVTNTSSLTTTLARGQSYVLSFGVTWKSTDGTSPSASAPVTLAISDPNIEAGDVVYAVTSHGLVKVGTATANGAITISFSAEPLFVVSGVPRLALTRARGMLSRSHKAIIISVDCSAATCNGFATLSVARKAGRDRFVHIALARGRYRVSPSGSVTLSLLLTKAGRERRARLVQATRFRLTLLTQVDGGNRLAAPVVLH